MKQGEVSLSGLWETLREIIGVVLESQKKRGRKGEREESLIKEIMAENLQNMERHFISEFMKFIDPPTNSPKVIFKIHYDKTLKSKIKKNFKATEKSKFLSC